MRLPLEVTFQLQLPTPGGQKTDAPAGSPAVRLQQPSLGPGVDWALFQRLWLMCHRLVSASAWYLQLLGDRTSSRGLDESNAALSVTPFGSKPPNTEELLYEQLAKSVRPRGGCEEHGARKQLSRMEEDTCSLSQFRSSILQRLHWKVVPQRRGPTPISNAAVHS
ncbi:unnamed protein product [Pleuronectes platessa]|uniref:Uncharacterized protein n=1 Tax=Pleuronectes platessa TaxID=8262 RepID=A0A9N7YTW1_PLEPL|nr:unnamed protein product [Pleuronectes platessa]